MIFYGRMPNDFARDVPSACPTRSWFFLWPMWYFCQWRTYHAIHTATHSTSKASGHISTSSAVYGTKSWAISSTKGQTAIHPGLIGTCYEILRSTSVKNCSKTRQSKLHCGTVWCQILRLCPSCREMKVRSKKLLVLWRNVALRCCLSLNAAGREPRDNILLEREWEGLAALHGVQACW